MNPNQNHDDDDEKVTQLLRALKQGQDSAKEELYQLVYPELRRMAHRYMSRENVGQTLQTTALVNEAYLKMADVKNLNWQDRAHFFAVSARVMKHILVDRARSKQAAIHGGGMKHVSMDEAINIPEAPNVDYLALNDALDRLSEMDARKSLIVELRYFGGLSNEEIAEVLKVSKDTVMRDWRFAKAWLQSELNGDHSHDESDNRNVRATHA